MENLFSKSEPEQVPTPATDNTASQTVATTVVESVIQSSVEIVSTTAVETTIATSIVTDSVAPEPGPSTAEAGPTTNPTPSLQPAPTNQPADGGGLSNGAKGGIAAGVVIVALLAVIIAFLLYRRHSSRKQQQQQWVQPAIPPPPPQFAHNPNDLEKNNVQTAVAPAWTELPKDDDFMSHSFREIDSRITQHVLNYYLGGAEPVSATDEQLRIYGSHVSHFERLVTDGATRIFVVRAIVAGELLGSVERGELSAANLALYNQQPEGSNTLQRAILHVAQNIHNLLTPLSSSSDPESENFRLQNLESVVNAAAEFSATAARQPSVFFYDWAGRQQGGRSVRFDSERMICSVAAPGSEQKQDGEKRVRAVVWPGLVKDSQGQVISLSKPQVVVD